MRLAIQANMNVGVLTCLIVLQPAIISILFFVIFRQKLKRNDVIAVILLITSIFLISIKFDYIWWLFSTDNWTEGTIKNENSSNDNSFARFKSISLMIFTLAIFINGNVMIKKITKYADLVFINNLIACIVAIPFTCILIYNVTINNKFQFWEFKIGILIGILNFMTSLLQPYWGYYFLIILCKFIKPTVVIYGKAGPSTAIIQTTSLVHAFLDAFLYNRMLTTFQYCSSQ